MAGRQECKVFIGGLSWETTDERLRRYFENYGVVQEAFVSYDRNTGRPRGFGFVVFEDHLVADKVVALQHTIDRREVEAKKAVPKDDQAAAKPPDGQAQMRTKKIFVGGLAPTVDEEALRKYFEQSGPVEDAIVMYDHDNKRPRGFGFVNFHSEESVDKVLNGGVMQTLHDKPIEIKRAVPRDQMPAARVGRVPLTSPFGRGVPALPGRGLVFGMQQQQPYLPQMFGGRGLGQGGQDLGAGSVLSGLGNSMAGLNLSMSRSSLGEAGLNPGIDGSMAGNLMGLASQLGQGQAGLAGARMGLEGGGNIGGHGQGGMIPGMGAMGLAAGGYGASGLHSNSLSPGPGNLQQGAGVGDPGVYGGGYGISGLTAAYGAGGSGFSGAGFQLSDPAGPGNDGGPAFPGGYSEGGLGPTNWS